MSVYSITIMYFFAFTILSYFLFNYLAGRPDLTRKRLENMDEFASKEKLFEQLQSLKKQDRGKIDPALRRFIEQFNVIINKKKEDDPAIRNRLLEAGYYSKQSIKILYGLKVLGAIVFLVLGIIAASIYARTNHIMYLIPLISAIVGYITPDIVLTMQIRKRQYDIAMSLPDMLDFLVICVEAGLGLNLALLRVGREMALRSPAISQELILVNQEMKTGLSREEALMNLGTRSRVRALKNLVSVIILSEKLGTNIADTLRAQSDSLRTLVRQTTEEQAAKSGIKILIPLVLFFLPALIMIVLGPGLLSIAMQFPQVINQ